MLLNLIPAPYRWVAMAIGVALIAAAGAAAASAFYQPRLELARQQAAEATRAYQALADAAQRQNAAVAQLQSEA